MRTTMMMQRGRYRIAHATAICLAVPWAVPRGASSFSATSSMSPDFSPKKGINKKLGGRSYLIDKIDPEATLSLREKVMWPGRPELCPLPMDASGLHLGYFDFDASTETETISNGATDPIGVISVFLEPDSAQFRKFAVDQEFQGMGVGSLLLRATIERVRGCATEGGIRVLWCDARVHQQAFYERFGFERIGEPFAKYSGSGGRTDNGSGYTSDNNDDREAFYVRMELELTMSSGESRNETASDGMSRS